MSNIKYNPLEDGITHLNTYSKGNTELGRFCSNFAYCPIETEDGHFDSIEGYWGWLGVSESNAQRDELRNLSGYKAKMFKDNLIAGGNPGRKDAEFQRKIRDAIHIKFQTKQARDLMNKNKELLSLPLCHYYVFNEDNGKIEIKDVTNDYPEFVNSVKEELAAYLKEQTSMFGVCKGIICQQVNCQDAMGAGLAKEIMDKYPIVSNKYHESFTKNSKESLFGKIDVIPIGEDFYVANIYSQFNYGNPKFTGRIYTDAEKLVKAVDALCKKYPNLPIYLPRSASKEIGDSDGIGCGLGGEKWSRLSKIFSELNHKNLYLLDTMQGIVHHFDNKIFGENIINKYENIESKYPKCKGLSLVEKSANQIKPNVDKSLYEGKVVVFDMETTGFSVDKGDEPLQISIVNEDCMTILNTYLKPYHKTSWKSAQMVNHISPLMVQNSPHLDEYSDFLQEVFDKSSVVVGHNVSFDIKFVEKCGKIEINKEKVFDTMKYFKKDEPKMKHKLEDAIKHYCPEAYRSYSNGAHNSYYDTIATTKVYNSIVEKMLGNDVIDRG